MGIMDDDCSIKFWLPKDLYNSLLAYAYRKRTSMSKALRTLCKAVEEVNMQYYIQLDIENKINPPREMSRGEWKKWRRDFKKSRPSLDDIFNQARENVIKDLNLVKKERKMEGMKAIKIWVSNDEFDAVKLAALVNKTSMSGLFRVYARKIAGDTRKITQDKPVQGVPLPPQTEPGGIDYWPDGTQETGNEPF